MKQSLARPFALAILALSVASARAVEIKIAAVDVPKVLLSYQKAITADAAFKQKAQKAQNDVKPALDARNQLQMDLQQLGQAINNKGTSEAEKGKYKEEFANKYKEFQRLGLELQQKEIKVSQEMQAEIATTRKALVADIMSAARTVGKANGCNLLVNSDPQNADIVLLQADASVDLTDKVIAELNKNAGVVKKATAVSMTELKRVPKN